MEKRKIFTYLTLGLMFLTIIVLVTPLRDKLAWRVEALRVRLQYMFNPPEEAVFVPQEGNQPTLPPTSTPEAAITPPQAVFTATPAMTPTPLPDRVELKGVHYFDQHGLWNYCAPSNLAMALSYWGWKGDRTDVGPVVKPFEKDKNVMLYELADYVRNHTDLKVAERSGGTLELLKSLIASGFPVLIEKGTYIRETTTGKVSWMGHYNVVTGYDDAERIFIVQDSYYTPDYKIQYATLQNEWRGFNYIFLVVYPAEQEQKLMAVLGDYADEKKSNQIAADIASQEIYTLSDADQFFAWFNRGTSLVSLQDYFGAAEAYDEAFKLNISLDKDTRPWRITWYQTGPYYAYYYSGRYQDVVNLTTNTLESAAEPYLEENYVWRARANIALGKTGDAVADLCQSLEYHPDFTPSVEALQSLGVAECPTK